MNTGLSGAISPRLSPLWPETAQLMVALISQRDHAILSFLYNTGARRSAADGIRFSIQVAELREVEILRPHIESLLNVRQRSGLSSAKPPTEAHTR